MYATIKYTMTTHNKFKIKLKNKIIQDKVENGQTVEIEPHVPSGVAKLSPCARDYAKWPTSLKELVLKQKLPPIFFTV